MIKSKYINEILNLLLELDSDGKSLAPQLTFLTDDKYDYTGSGLFVWFTYDPEGERHRLEFDKMVLDGVRIKAAELKDGANAVLFVSNGLIEYLEIHSRNAMYPNTDLTNYTLEVEIPEQ